MPDDTTNSLKEVIVGASLQSDRGIPEDGPAKSFIIPAATFTLDPEQEKSQLKADNCGHIVGVVPLGYSVKSNMVIYGYPEKSFFGELLAMAIGSGSVSRLGSVGLARFIPSVPAIPGLNDAVSGGSYTGTVDATYTIEIDTEGTPDKIKIKKDSGSYGAAVNITASPVSVGDGITISLATTGHTAGDKWTIKAFATNAYRHTFNPEIAPEVATVWSHERAGELKAGDVGVNKLTIKIDQNKEAQTTADLIGGSIQISSDIGTPTAAHYPAAEDGSKIFRSGIATLEFGQTGSAIRTNLRTLDISIDRGLKADEGRTQDSMGNASIYPSQNLLTVKLEFLLTTLEELMRSWDGAKTTAPKAISPDDVLDVSLPALNLKLTPPAVICSTIDSAIPASGNTSPCDLETSGDYDGREDETYTIKISTAGATDKFQVKKGSGAFGSEISITGLEQDIGNGVKIAFGSITGHVQGDSWTIHIKAFRYQLELDAPAVSGKYKPGQSGSRRTGSLELVPVSSPVDDPYTFYLTNTHAEAYT